MNAIYNAVFNSLLNSLLFVWYMRVSVASIFITLTTTLRCWHNLKGARCSYEDESSLRKRRFADNYIIYFSQACLKRQRNHLENINFIQIEAVYLNKIYFHDDRGNACDTTVYKMEIFSH